MILFSFNHFNILYLPLPTQRKSDTNRFINLRRFTQGNRSTIFFKGDKIQLTTHNEGYFYIGRGEKKISWAIFVFWISRLPMCLKWKLPPPPQICLSICSTINGIKQSGANLTPLDKTQVLKSKFFLHHFSAIWTLSILILLAFLWGC